MNSSSWEKKSKVTLCCHNLSHLVCSGNVTAVSRVGKKRLLNAEDGNSKKIIDYLVSVLNFLDPLDRTQDECCIVKLPYQQMNLKNN